MKIVEVEWEDAVGSSGWHDPDNTMTEPSRIVSVGYLISESKKGITLMQSWDFDCKKRDHTICIPKNRITKKKVIRK